MEVYADHPVSVVSGIQRGNWNFYWGFPWLQLPPLDRWGTRFLALPTTSSPDPLNNVYTIMASEHDTEVTVNRTALTLRLTSAMEWRTEELDARYTHLIKSNKPVLVLRSTPASNGTQPSIVALTNTSAMAATLTLAAPDTSSWPGDDYVFNVVFVTERSTAETVTVNGQLYDMEWSQVLIMRTTSGSHLE